eukprot:5711164-Pyramimonas_sp.AAC.1
MAATMSASSTMAKAVVISSTTQRSSKASASRPVFASKSSAFGGKQLKMQQRQQRQLAKRAVT